MNIGINPYVPEFHRESSHITSMHLLPLLEIATEVIARLGHTPIAIPITDIEFKENAVGGKFHSIEYKGTEQLGLILDLNYVACPKLLHNYVCASIWGNKNFTQVLALNTKYIYGENAHFDLAPQFIFDTINDAITNAQNFNFDLGRF